MGNLPFSKTESCQRVVCVLLLAVFWLLFPATTPAANVTVDCSDPAQSISAALQGLDTNGPHTITVIGTCTEKITIADRQNLTIEAPSGQTATVANAAAQPRQVFNIIRSKNITLRRLIIRGGRNGVNVSGASANILLEECTIEQNIGTGISASQNSHLYVNACVVRNNGNNGIGVDSSSLYVNPPTVIENNGAQGINLTNSRAEVYGDFAAPNIFRGNGSVGLRAASGSTVNVWAPNIFQGNGAAGLTSVWGSHVNIYGSGDDAGVLYPNVFEGNSWTGIRVGFGAQATLYSPAILRNNGSSSDPTSAGLRVEIGGILLLAGGTGSDRLEITSNIGPGIEVAAQASFMLNGSALISGNGADGIRVTRLSWADFYQDPTTPISILGNGGATISCDSTSLLTGELGGIDKIACKNIERPKGPPRPGRIDPPGQEKNP